MLTINHVSFPDPKLIATGPHTFRRADRESASLAFFEDGGEVYKVGSFSAQRREPLWHVLVIFAVGFCVIAGALTGVVMLLRRKWLGVLPLASIAALAVTAILPIRAFWRRIRYFHRRGGRRACIRQLRFRENDGI